jgi:hypothetical protein
MKRHGHLWDQVRSFEALLHAAEQARKGKRFRPAVAAFGVPSAQATRTIQFILVHFIAGFLRRRGPARLGRRRA